MSIKNAFLSLFRKSDAPKVVDVVWLSEKQKLEACAAVCRSSSQAMIVVWFDDTRRKVEQLFFKEGISDTLIYNASNVSALTVHNREVVFAEHYPLLEKEQKLFTDLQLKEVTVYSSLDEALFKKFGGEKIIELMKKMGANEGESLNHPMISGAIRNAQEKVSRNISFDQYASSQHDWLTKNVAPIE